MRVSENYGLSLILAQPALPLLRQELAQISHLSPLTAQWTKQDSCIVTHW